MKMLWLTLVPLLALTSGGCNMMYYTAHNLTNEPLVVCKEISVNHTLRKEARQIVSTWECSQAGAKFAHEFRDGFVDGYADYSAYGGTTDPVPVAPPRYTRSKKYLGPEGQAALDSYFLGFRHGVEVAVASGRREKLLTRVILPPPPKEPPVLSIKPRALDREPPVGLPPPRPLEPGSAPAPERPGLVPERGPRPLPDGAPMWN